MVQAMTICFDEYDCKLALRIHDEKSLAAIFDRDPIATLRQLDYAMRGLKEVNGPWQWYVDDHKSRRAHVDWLSVQDRRFRRRLGWRQQNADLLVLREAYQAGDLILIVGAGVSMAAGMPGWKDLVIGMLDRALTWHDRLADNVRRTRIVSIDGKISFAYPEKDIEHFIKEKITPLSGKQRSRLEQAREDLKAMESYDDRILLEATQLTQEIFGVDFNGVLRNFLFNHTLYRTKIHPAIARMVRPKQDKPGTLTPRIWAILTYNFNDLLELAIRAEGYSFTVEMSRRGEIGQLWGGDRNVPSAVDILHVHGFTHNHPEWITFPIHEVDLVFSAKQYELQYGSNSSFVRRIHEAFLVNTPALIIGSSLTDEYAVSQMTAAHERRPGWFQYCLMQLPTEYRATPAQLGGDLLEKLSERYRDMGLHAIWFSEFSEIPDILGAIRKPVPQDPLWISELAYNRGDIISEEQALLDALRLGDSPRAMFNLAIIQQSRGDIEQAVDLYRKVLNMNHPEWSPKAAMNLGLLLERTGDMDGAERVYRDGMSFGNPEWRTRCASKLGERFYGRNDLTGAEQVWRETIRLVQQAASNRDLLLTLWGELEEAEHELYRETTRLGHHAAINVGQLLEEKGDLIGAEQVYRDGAHLGDSPLLANLMFSYALILKENDKSVKAEMIYREVMKLNNYELSERAAHNLGVMLRTRGDLGEAEVFLRKARASNNPELAQHAAYNLGVLLVQRGELNGAVTEFLYAAEHPNLSERAKAHLNKLSPMNGEAGDGY